MKLHEIVNKVALHNYTATELLDVDVHDVYISDLLSDVMGNAKQNQLWITLQSHKNVIAVAALKDIAGVVFINGVCPSDDLIELANQKGIALLGTTETAFNTGGKLYQLLLMS
jgi:predicted transcriptional regulator